MLTAELIVEEGINNTYLVYISTETCATSAMKYQSLSFSDPQNNKDFSRITHSADLGATSDY